MSVQISYTLSSKNAATISSFKLNFTAQNNKDFCLNKNKLGNEQQLFTHFTQLKCKLKTIFKSLLAHIPTVSHLGVL